MSGKSQDPSAYAVTKIRRKFLKNVENRECGKQILRACEGTGRAEKAGESGKKYGLLQLYMGILLLLVVSVSGNVPYSGVNREKISLYGSRAEQGDKKEDPAAVQSAVKPEPLNLNSRSAVLMDADTGRVLYGKMRQKTFRWPAPQRS